MGEAKKFLKIVAKCLVKEEMLTDQGHKSIKTQLYLKMTYMIKAIKSKKINSIIHYGLCEKCKDIIEWKVKFKKYKPLTKAKKCVKCLENKVLSAYYIVCEDCSKEKNFCSKCAKSCESIEFGESEREQQKNKEDFEEKLKSLPERKRRTLLRLLEKDLIKKEDFDSNSKEESSLESDPRSEMVEHMNNMSILTEDSSEEEYPDSESEYHNEYESELENDDDLN